MTISSSAVADLQGKWHTLPDLDRARAVYMIHQAGVSLRELAKGLNCSPSLLGYLLVALQAPALDRALARDGSISTRELARRARATGIRRATRHREALELDRERAALVGRQAIFDWLAAENISSSYGEQIVDEARSLLATAEQTAKLPRGAAPPDMLTTEIIQRCKPTVPCTDAISFVAWGMPTGSLSGPSLPCRTLSSASPLSTSPSKDCAKGKLLGQQDLSGQMLSSSRTSRLGIHTSGTLSG